MLRRIKGRKSFTMPDVRGSPGEFALTKRRAILEIVKEERSTYDLKSREYQSHQGHDTRGGRVGMNRNNGVTGMRNNSNEDYFSKSAPGRQLRYTQDVGETMRKVGTSYYRRSEARGDASQPREASLGPKGHSVTFGNNRPHSKPFSRGRNQSRLRDFDVWSD